MLEKTNFSNEKDSFKDYTFSAQEWSAPTMVSVAEIDEPFLIGFEDGDSFEIDAHQEPEFRINYCGADFWNHLNRYKTQLNDMCKWTELVPSQNEKINIYGF